MSQIFPGITSKTRMTISKNKSEGQSKIYKWGDASLISMKQLKT